MTPLRIEIDRSERTATLLALCVVLALLTLAHAASAAPFAYVGNRSTDTVTVIDIGGGEKRADVPVRETPRDVAAHPDGSVVYVATHEGITLLDTLDLTTRDVDLCCSNGGVVVHPNGNQILVAQRNTASVALLDRNANFVDAIAHPFVGAYRIALGVNHVYIVSEVGQLAAADLGNLSAGFQELTIGGAALGPYADDPKGLAVDVWGTVWVSSETSRAVYALPTSHLTGMPFYVAQAASGFEPGTIGIASTLGFGQRLFVADPAGDRAAGLVGTSDIAVPGGGPLAVAGGQDGLVVIGNDRDVTGLNTDPNFGSVTVVPDSGPAWSVPANRNPDSIAIGPGSEADLNCSPNPLRFSYSKFGMTKRGTISVSSTGNEDLRIGTLSVDGRDAGNYAIASDSCSGATLAPGASCSVEVEFTPQPVWAPSPFVKFGAIGVFNPRFDAELLIPTNAGGASLRRNGLQGEHFTKSLEALLEVGDSPYTLKGF